MKFPKFRADNPSSQAAGEKAKADPPLVEVNGQILTAEDLNERVEAQLAQQAETLAPNQMAEALAHLRVETIKDFINTVLLEGEAAGRGLTVPPAELEKAMDEVAARLPPGTKLKEALAMGGMSLDELKARLTKELRVKLLVDRELAGAPSPTEADAEAFYREQQAALESIRPFAECKAQILAHLNKLARHNRYKAMLARLKGTAAIRLDPAIRAEIGE